LKVELENICKENYYLEKYIYTRKSQKSRSHKKKPIKAVILVILLFKSEGCLKPLQRDVLDVPMVTA
jgi:hypothetical protein